MKTLSVSVSLFFITSTYAATLNLGPGETVTIQPNTQTVVSCVGNPPIQQVRCKIKGCWGGNWGCKHPDCEKEKNFSWYYSSVGTDKKALYDELLNPSSRKFNCWYEATFSCDPI